MPFITSGDHHASGQPTAGAVLLAESLFTLLLGADLVPHLVTVGRAEVFQRLRESLLRFRAAGGGTIVDVGGFSTGRDADQLALLSTVTSVRIVASTGFGPVWSIGSHFPGNVSFEGMTVDRMADILIREVTEGLMDAPRRRLPGRAGLISLTVAEREVHPVEPRYFRPFEPKLFHAGARAAVATGAALSLRVNDRPEDTRRYLDIVAAEGLAPDRVIVSGVDRISHAGLAREWAEQGYTVGLDHVGWPTGGVAAPVAGEGGSAGAVTRVGGAVMDAPTRVRTVLDLFEAGLGDRVTVSSSAIGVAVEWPAPVHGDLTAVLEQFVPDFRAAGGTEEQLTALLRTTPGRLLALAAPAEPPLAGQTFGPPSGFNAMLAEAGRGH